MKNKWLKRFACVALSAALVVELAVFTGASTAYAKAKTPATGKISLTVTQDYKQAQAILKYVNKYRKKKHLKALKLDKDLTKAAITRGAELNIYTPQTSPHRRPNGKLTKTLNKRICYEDCLEIGGSYYMEPSEFGASGSITSAKAVVDSWIASPPHRKGLLLSKAKCAGIAATYTTTEYGYITSVTYSIEFSNTKVKKVEKSKSKVKYTKNVDTKNEYLKKKYFSIRSSIDQLYNENPSMRLYTDYNSPYMYARPILNPSSFTWTSSNKDIATVNKNGIVKKGSKTGKVKITAKLKTGTKVSFSKTLTVK